MKAFFESMKKFKVLWIVVLVFAALIVIANENRLNREKIIYAQSLDMVVATVEGAEITLRDFAVYVAHEEQTVQEQAEIYDADNTRKYWNVHTEYGFMNQVARNEAMSMAIHDTLFYQLYQGLDMELSETEKIYLQNDVEDFWADLTDEEKDTKLGITKEDVYNTMYRIACAQKAQYVYAGMNGVDYADFDCAEEEFLDFLEEYEYDVKDDVLNRLDFGNITLEHK